MKRFLCVLLCLCILGQSALAATPAKSPFLDTQGHWAEEYIALCRDAGLIEGVSEELFDPEGKLTIAQCAAAAVRFHARLTGGMEPAKGQPWYANYVAYMENLGCMLPGDVNANCTREQFIIMMDTVIAEKGMVPINEINVLPDTRDDRVISFYRAGILTGMDEYGTFLGRLDLTRAECAAMLARMENRDLRIKFKPRPTDGSDAMQCLYIPADETALTISGYPVRAEIFTAALDCQLEIQEAYYQLREHPEYEKYLTEWLNRPYTIDFERYLQEFCGKGKYSAVDWNAIDEESALPMADLAYEKTLNWLESHAALRAMAEKYSVVLTGDQEKQIENYLEKNKIEDRGRKLYVTTALTDKLLKENLYAHHRVAEDEIVSLVARGDWLCAEFVRFEKVSLTGEPLTEGEIDYIRYGAELYRQELSQKESHYFFQKHTKDLECAYTPPRATLISREKTPDWLWQKLSRLHPLGLSEVIETEDGIYIWLVENPSASDGLMEDVCVNFGIDRAEEEMADFLKNGSTVLSDAVNYLIPAEYAEKIFND